MMSDLNDEYEIEPTEYFGERGWWLPVLADGSDATSWYRDDEELSHYRWQSEEGELAQRSVEAERVRVEEDDWWRECPPGLRRVRQIQLALRQDADAIVEVYCVSKSTSTGGEVSGCSRRIATVRPAGRTYLVQSTAYTSQDRRLAALTNAQALLDQGDTGRDLATTLEASVDTTSFPVVDLLDEPPSEWPEAMRHGIHIGCEHHGTLLVQRDDLRSLVRDAKKDPKRRKAYIDTSRAEWHLL